MASNLAWIKVAIAMGGYHQANCLSHLFAGQELPVWEVKVATEQEEVHSKAFEALEISKVFKDP